MKKTISLLFALSSMLILASCDKYDDPDPAGHWSNSVFIVNEGPFQNGTGTVMAYDRVTGEVSADLFEAANGRPLGNIVQSMYVYEDKAFIIVNNSNKIEVVNLDDFKSVATIENLILPRYFLVYDDEKAYVTCWDSTVKVIDMADYSIKSSIKVGAGPDEMLLVDDQLFVVNSGGFGVDNKVSVINTNTDLLTRNITVGDRPASIVKDANNTIWVLCSGKGWNGFPDPSDTEGHLIRFSPVTYEIVDDVIFIETDIHPDNMVIDENGALLYYNHPEGIYRFSIAFGYFDSEPFIPLDKMLYGLGFDQTEDMIYATDPLDYSQNGYIYRYNSYDGSAVDTVMAGVIPNGFWFN
jgi:YVTN family beta-propeller protein